MQSAKERVSERALRLAKSGKSVRLYATPEVAKRLSVRSMSLMRWVVKEEISCPAFHVCTDTGLHWLWNEEEIRRVAKFKKGIVSAKGQRGKLISVTRVERAARLQRDGVA